MDIRLRKLPLKSNLPKLLELSALTQVVSPQVVREATASVRSGASGTRIRKLSPEVSVWLAIGMSLYADLALTEVLQRMSQGLSFLWPDEESRKNLLPSKSAICQRRYQLRARPLARIAETCCRPVATPETKGAFLCGLRLMAIDGYLEDTPDSPQNAAVFGRHTTHRGDSAFPQVLIVALAECGTHALVDATFWPCRAGEHKGARRLLRSVTPEMLVMWDRGLFSYDLVAGVCRRGAQVLVRLPAGVLGEPGRKLADGSVLTKFQKRNRDGRKIGDPLEVRIITYTVESPKQPGEREEYRIMTTLLDPVRYPARVLACAYHERWEFELAVDEQQTHQREEHLMTSPLRSRKPVGIIQELYGLWLAHYAIRRLMHEAAVSENADPDRISFIHALRVIQDAHWQFQIVAPDLLPLLYQRLLGDLARPPLPPRDGRNNPRVVRRKMSGFPLKRLEHKRWAQPLQPPGESLVLI